MPKFTKVARVLRYGPPTQAKTWPDREDLPPDDRTDGADGTGGEGGTDGEGGVRKPVCPFGDPGGIGAVRAPDPEP